MNNYESLSQDDLKIFNDIFNGFSSPPSQEEKEKIFVIVDNFMTQRYWSGYNDGANDPDEEYNDD